jgi:hypothetical protein
MNKLCLLLSSFLLLSQSTVWAAQQETLPRVDFAETPEWSLTGTQFGGKLLLSDSPETVNTDGIMYEDTVSGDVRLFFHHVNGTKEPKKIFVLLENAGKSEADISVYHYGFSGPGSDYGAVGKAAQQDYLANGHSSYDVTIPAGQKDYLWSAQKSMIVRPDELINGIFDFKISQPVKLKVVMVPIDYNEQTLRNLKVLDNDVTALRGTFEGRDKLLLPYDVYNPSKDGVVAITLADNNIDHYAVGTDMTTGKPVMNYGNYGVMYRIFIPSLDDNQKFKGYLNPMGGEYGGALGIKYDHKILDPLLTPSGTIMFGANTITAVSPIGSYDSGKSLWFTFSPPGASNLPVRLLFVPEPLLDKGPGIITNQSASSVK